MLDKRLQIGGLQVGGPRTAQNPARFRIADNVYQTRDEQMVPRCDGTEYLDLNPTADTARNIFRYKNNPFYLGYKSGQYVPFYNSNTVVPTPGLPAEYGSFGVQNIEKLDNLYMNFPSKGLYKYDGYQVYRAGSPLPYAEPESQALISLAFYVRLIQHHIDQQGNIVSSGYTETRIGYTTGTQITVRTDKGASDNFSTSRQPIELASLANGYMANFIRSTTIAHVSGDTYTVTTGGDHNVIDGQYLMWNVSDYVVFTPSGGVTTLAKGVAYQVISHTGTTVTIGNPRYLDISGEWSDIVGATGLAPANGDIFAHYWISVWTATESTGNYSLQGIVASVYESNNNYTKTFSVPDPDLPPSSFFQIPAFNLAGNLGDIYDVLSVKQVFPVTTRQIPSSFGTYGDLGIISYSNEIYFSDITLGGAFEMTNSAAFIVVGEGDDGDIQAIAGTSDFMLVSRQFKNYYVNGNLPTANYRVSEIPETSLGVYSNESLIAIADKIIFMNMQGVWAVYSGGRCEEISFSIRGLFNNFARTASFSEEEFFDLNGFPIYASSTQHSQWIHVRVDVNRNLVAFVIKNVDYESDGRCLILNLNNGEFYTWSGLTHSATSANFYDIAFIGEVFWFTHNDTGQAAIFVEDGNNFDYMESYPAQLHTSWFTGGEPSLEKKLNQLKMWGVMENQTVSMSYKADWQDDTETECPSYESSNQAKFSHKTRLKPYNFQAISVGMTFEDMFQIEGIELEWQPLQTGMKR